MEDFAVKKLKKRLKELAIIGLVVLVLVLAVNTYELPKYHVHENTITRNLAWMILPMPEEPEGRTKAWDSELPEFVKNDIHYAEEHGYRIEYEFKGNVISIEKRENRWRISLKTRIDNGAGWDSLENFSMYQTKDHKIVIYGYCFAGNKWFQKLTLQKNESRIDTITYDKSLPLDEFPGGASIGAMSVGGYSLIYKEQTFTFYRDGQRIISQDFLQGTIEDVDLYNGTLLTVDKKLYNIYVELVEEMPKLIFAYVGTIDAIVETYAYRENLQSYEEEQYNLVMVKKDGKYCAVVPNDWESFDKYALPRNAEKLYQPTAEFDYSAKLIELGTSLSEVQFNYLTNGQWWYATIIFDFNGRKFYSKYFFDGYDNSVNIPENVVKVFTDKTITSFDKMWETISDIREIYFNYYEKRGDFVS